MIFLEEKRGGLPFPESAVKLVAEELGSEDKIVASSLGIKLILNIYIYFSNVEHRSPHKQLSVFQRVLKNNYI